MPLQPIRFSSIDAVKKFLIKLRELRILRPKGVDATSFEIEELSRRLIMGSDGTYLLDELEDLSKDELKASDLTFPIKCSDTRGLLSESTIPVFEIERLRRENANLIHNKPLAYALANLAFENDNKFSMQPLLSAYTGMPILLPVLTIFEQSVESLEAVTHLFKVKEQQANALLFCMSSTPTMRACFLNQALLDLQMLYLNQRYTLRDSASLKLNEWLPQTLTAFKRSLAAFCEQHPRMENVVFKDPSLAKEDNAELLQRYNLYRINKHEAQQRIKTQKEEVKARGELIFGNVVLSFLIITIAVIPYQIYKLRKEILKLRSEKNALKNIEKDAEVVEEFWQDQLNKAYELIIKPAYQLIQSLEAMLAPPAPSSLVDSVEVSFPSNMSSLQRFTLLASQPASTTESGSKDLSMRRIM